MIYYYKHKSCIVDNVTETSLTELSGVIEYAESHGIPIKDAILHIKQLEQEIQMINGSQIDFSCGDNLDLFNNWINCYIDYFNNYATFDKQAYVLIGNIASGKNTYALKIEEQTGSIIVDADRFKMGEETPHGFFKGYTSLYQLPTDRERMQNMCGEAGKRTMRTVADLGMNMILPKAPTNFEKLERQLQYLIDKNYDIHLILFDTPANECVRRSYLRYFVKEFSREKHSDGSAVHGRFVPKSVVMDIGDGPYLTFAKALKRHDIFSSYKAFHNDFNKANTMIDISTMILPE